MPEMTRLVVEAVPETVSEVEEAYGNTEAMDEVAVINPTVGLFVAVSAEDEVHAESIPAVPP